MNDRPDRPLRSWAHPRLGRHSAADRAWRVLSELQRFARFKLSRDDHDNFDVLPAMREFGLA